MHGTFPALSMWHSFVYLKGPHEYALEYYLATKVVTFQADIKEGLYSDINSDVDFALHRMGVLMKETSISRNMILMSNTRTLKYYISRCTVYLNRRKSR